MELRIIDCFSMAPEPVPEPTLNRPGKTSESVEKKEKREFKKILSVQRKSKGRPKTMITFHVAKTSSEKEATAASLVAAGNRSLENAENSSTSTDDDSDSDRSFVPGRKRQEKRRPNARRGRKKSSRWKSQSKPRSLTSKHDTEVSGAARTLMLHQVTAMKEQNDSRDKRSGGGGSPTEKSVADPKQTVGKGPAQRPCPLSRKKENTFKQRPRPLSKKKEPNIRIRARQQHSSPKKEKDAPKMLSGSPLPVKAEASSHRQSEEVRSHSADHGYSRPNPIEHNHQGHYPPPFKPFYIIYLALKNSPRRALTEEQLMYFVSTNFPAFRCPGCNIRRDIKKELDAGISFTKVTTHFTDYFALTVEVEMPNFTSPTLKPSEFMSDPSKWPKLVEGCSFSPELGLSMFSHAAVVVENRQMGFVKPAVGYKSPPSIKPVISAVSEENTFINRSPALQGAEKEQVISNNRPLTRARKYLSSMVTVDVADAEFTLDMEPTLDDCNEVPDQDPLADL